MSKGYFLLPKMGIIARAPKAIKHVDRKKPRDKILPIWPATFHLSRKAIMKRQGAGVNIDPRASARTFCFSSLDPCETEVGGLGVEAIDLT